MSKEVEITRENFKEGTIADFQLAPDLEIVSHDEYTSKEDGSLKEAFKYSPTGVYRTSENWGANGLNLWSINSKATTGLRTGFCAWDKFRKLDFIRRAKK